MHLWRFLDKDGEGGDAGAGDDKGAKGAADATAQELADLRKWRQERESADAKSADEKRKADEAEALKRGEHEKVLKAKDADLTSTKAKLAEYEARETKRGEAVAAKNKARIEALPERARKLVPGGMDPDAVSAWLDEAADFLGGDEDPVRGARRAKTTEEPEIPEAAKAEWERNIKHLGLSLKDWFPTWQKLHPIKKT